MNPKALSEKGAHDIPSPVTTGIRRPRWTSRILFWLSTVIGVYVIQRTIYSTSTGDSYSSNISDHLDSKHYKHHKHHKPLFGKKAEKLFLSIPDEESCTAASRYFASKPHPAGSDSDLDTAKEWLKLLRHEFSIDSPEPPVGDSLPIFPAGSPESRAATLGISAAVEPKAWIDIYYPVMNTPLDMYLQVVDDEGAVSWEADLEEHAELYDKEDPEAALYSNTVPTFHGLSHAGNVTGKLVYANYGLKEDYDALETQGISIEGTVVIARYGGNFRGLKIKGAQERGALGVIIYSDPRDDGSVTVENGYEPYPFGPARNEHSVQRGSVQFLSLYPGDPTTPGYPSYANATRTDGENIPKIPSLPISWFNAKTLMKKAGINIEDGAQSTTEVQVRLINNVNTRVMPIWNTMAVIPGHIKDEVIVVGNHRDAWVMGASDPSSGTATMHETVKGLGALMKQGWKPLRTIVLASWDAEEYGLIGSTEWGEDFEQWIGANVVAYLNLDSSVSGSKYGVAASPLLAHFVAETAMDVPHPTIKHKSLWDATRDNGSYFCSNATDKEDLEILSQGLDVDVLGSGSDFTVFLQRIGIASMNHGFGGTSNDPVYHYHSVYDSQTWMERYGDPGFHRHVAVAKHQGLLTLRLASALLLPFNTTHYTNELESYLEKVASLTATRQSFNLDLSPLRNSIGNLKSISMALDYERLVTERELFELIDKVRHEKKKFWKIWCKIRKALGFKCKRPHHRDGHGHKKDLQHFHAKCNSRPNHDDHLVPMDHELQLVAAAIQLPPSPEILKVLKHIRAINKKLVAFERGFISEEGISERPWFKHLGVAPGRWLGYGATTFPALTESITFENDEKIAAYEAQRLKNIVDKLAAGLSA